MVKHVIFHGHFYQPPRENPWTGVIPHQDSASPFENWNERIFHQCYRANSASRYLDPNGKVVKINNNYEKLSFNFGPTLLNWIKEHHPNTYALILEADKKSCLAFNGHGNAIAQVYNHIIMPLANEEQKRVQIQWGIEDFKSHFNRAPEGMWLAETAVDHTTVDLLVEYGIKFIILSPWQANAIKEIGETKWKQVTNPLDVASDPFYIETPKGANLAVFFYDHILAQGISFEHYLQDADKVYQILLDKAVRSNKLLINCATDGEVYGHHEPYGDMCFSALTQKINESNVLCLNNYANFLELYPPTQLVRIKLGEKNLGSSWSCYHGVSRWYKDCGCNTGNQEGWNQKWRKPLRDSFDYLDKQIDTVYKTQISRYTNSDPFEILTAYIDILTKKKSYKEFATQYGIKDEKSTSAFFKLLEAKKYALYMYTSCGWFFSELSGLEPTQNICYALCGLQLIQEFLPKNEATLIHEKFLHHLDEAKCNIKEKGSAKDIANSIIQWNQKSPYTIACNQIAATIARSESLTGTIPSSKESQSITIPINKKVGNYYFHEIISVAPYDRLHGTIKFESSNFQEKFILDFDTVVTNDEQIFFSLKDKQTKTEYQFPVKEAHVSPRVQQKMLLKLFDSWEKEDHLFNTILVLLDDISFANQEFTSRQKEFYKNILNLRASKIINEVLQDPSQLSRQTKYIQIILNTLCKGEDNVDPVVSNLLSKLVYEQITKLFSSETPQTNSQYIIKLLKTIYANKINCDLTSSQGVAYNLLIGELQKENDARTKLRQQQESAVQTISDSKGLPMSDFTYPTLIETVCDYLNINTAHIRYEVCQKDNSHD